MGEKVTRVITFDDVPVAKPAAPSDVGRVRTVGKQRVVTYSHEVHDVEIEMPTHEGGKILISGQGFIEVTELIGKDSVRKSFKVTIVRGTTGYEKPFHPANDGLDF